MLSRLTFATREIDRRMFGGVLFAWMIPMLGGKRVMAQPASPLSFREFLAKLKAAGIDVDRRYAVETQYDLRGNMTRHYKVEAPHLPG